MSDDTLFIFGENNYQAKKTMVTSKKSALKIKLVTIFNAVSFCIRLNQNLVYDDLIDRIFSTIIPQRIFHLVCFCNEFNRIEVNSTTVEVKLGDVTGQKNEGF